MKPTFLHAYLGPGLRRGSGGRKEGAAIIAGECLGSTPLCPLWGLCGLCDEPRFAQAPVHEKPAGAGSGG